MILPQGIALFEEDSYLCIYINVYVCMYVYN